MPYTLEGIEVEGCNATENGGGLYVENVRALRLTGMTKLDANEALRGGGIYFACADPAARCALDLFAGPEQE